MINQQQAVHIQELALLNTQIQAFNSAVTAFQFDDTSRYAHNNNDTYFASATLGAQLVQLFNIVDLTLFNNCKEHNIAGFNAAQEQFQSALLNLYTKLHRDELNRAMQKSINANDLPEGGTAAFLTFNRAQFAKVANITVFKKHLADAAQKSHCLLAFRAFFPVDPSVYASFYPEVADGEASAEIEQAVRICRKIRDNLNKIEKVFDCVFDTAAGDTSSKKRALSGQSSISARKRLKIT